MGDIKKPKKKYLTPSHPWIQQEIDEYRQARQDYGLTKRKELLITNSFLKKYKDIAKRLIADTTAQGQHEKEQMLTKLTKYGLLSAGARVDDVLSLQTKDLLERRLQTMVVRKGLARSFKQARQLIVHRHILSGSNEITSPSYLVPVDEEANLSFKVSSSLAQADHPERVNIAKPIVEKPKRPAKKDEKKRKRR